ncbi:MAG: MerR family transcriptional regulator [Inquilinus sp.]|uniref:MerR family transcriptional regulator n=1 Tax=Inquilinus sp. TaxID=1932117 RepID=UPI003F38E0B0
MLISEFSRRTGLARETVRYYVRMGLLQPRQTQKGGRHPYLMFTEDDVNSADVIRVGQKLGLSLREIGDLRDARRRGDLPLTDRIAMMKDQLAKLEAKSAELDRLQAYVRAKIAWQESGEKSAEPQLGAFLDVTTEAKPGR